MTPTFTSEDFAALGAPNLVYVRPVKAKEVMALSQGQDDRGFSLDPDQTLYAVHRAVGAMDRVERLIGIQREPPVVLALAQGHDLLRLHWPHIDKIGRAESGKVF